MTLTDPWALPPLASAIWSNSREGGEGRREGGKEGGREGGREIECWHFLTLTQFHKHHPTSFIPFSPYFLPTLPPSLPPPGLRSIGCRQDSVPRGRELLQQRHDHSEALCRGREGEREGRGEEMKRGKEGGRGGGSFCFTILTFMRTFFFTRRLPNRRTSRCWMR